MRSAVFGRGLSALASSASLLVLAGLCVQPTVVRAQTAPDASNSSAEKTASSDVKMAALGAPAPAFAQQAPAEATAAPASDANQVSEVVVVGVRKALVTSQQIKKSADTVVDSITATDIGAFPDKSASEALQRVPGLTVNRLQSNDDSTHPSGEPTNVLIRGLTQVRTEFNGRDSFSADAARGLNFNDVSPELLAGVDAYKNQTADMIEGGLAGTVDLRTRLPFDQKGPVFVVNLVGDYGDRSNKSTKEVSGLLSDTFDTEYGRFGFLADRAESHVFTEVDSVVDDKIDTYCSSGFGTANKAIVNSNGSIPCTGNAFGGSGWAFAPDGVRYSKVDYDRHRYGTTLAGQYENNERTLLVTLQYTDSQYSNAWLEDASHAILDGSYYGTPAFNPRSSTILAPVPGGSPLVFGKNGMLQSGTLAQPHSGEWFGTCGTSNADAINAASVVPGVPFVNVLPTCSNAMSNPNQDGLQFQDEARNFNHTEDTKDFSAHVRWKINDQLTANFDAQHIKANVFNNDILVATGSLADYQFSTNGDGTPSVKFLPSSNTNMAAGGLTNPANYWIPFIQGHEENNNATESAYRADAKYKIIGSSWLDSLQVGVRYADRDQTVRYSSFNWTPIAAPWNCNGPGFSIANTTPGAYPTTGACGGNTGHPDFKGYGAGIWGTDNFNNFYGSGVYPNGPLVFLNRATLQNFPALIQALSGPTTNSPIGSGYTQICARPGTTNCFLPSEVLSVRETTEAAYARLNFGGPNASIFGLNIVGNVGLRVVQTEENSAGSVSFPTATDLQNLAPCGTPLSGNNIVNPSCYLTSAITQFSNGGGSPSNYKSTHLNWLPDFNVRLGLDDKDFVRFGYSRAISRPDFGLMRNFVQINSPVINTTADSPYIVYNSPTAAHTAANVTGYNFVFQANAGNAALRPQQADQFDLTFERYMSSSSSFTFGLFYKQLSDSLGYAKFNRSFTNSGATETVQVTGPFNEAKGGSLSGFEVAYQTFFDRLPGLLSGLGMQTNFTYVKQHGINNANLADDGGLSAGSVGAFGAGVNAVLQPTIDSHRLAGISDETFNLVGLYEKGPFAFRLAYNWRSRYLTDNLDCCIGLPVFQKAAGFLDGSARWSPNKHVEIAFEVSNILNTTTVYQQEVFGDSPATPGAKPVYMDSGWTRQDRRYQLGLRLKF